MGVKNLWDILESCKKTHPLHKVQNKRLCIDLSCWIVQFQNAAKSHSFMKDKVYLRGLFHRLRALIALNCSLIFVTDGAIPAIKLSTYKRRLNLGNEATKDDSNLPQISSLKRNMGSEFSLMIKEAKLLGTALGIPCLDGLEEAEAQCALLNAESLCDGCFTSDSDAFLFGARTVYRDICLGDNGYVVCYEMSDIEKKLGFGRNSLITLALILGSDYSYGVHGLGRESACQIVKSIGDSAVLERIASEGLSFAKKTKAPKKLGLSKRNNEENLPNHDTNKIENKHIPTRVDQFLPVIDAYLRPKCHSADSDVVQRVLVNYPFRRIELHQICVQFFEWPPEKTDEYILPKIAERNLRRFSNLRSVSSELGLKPPLEEIPIKCPVLEILKNRKVQGKECFEVSWDGFEGLECSVVLKDLLESACPEKIMEFEEKRAQNRRKTKPKKSKEGSALIELDKKLQALLLEIESEDKVVCSRGFSETEISISCSSSSSQVGPTAVNSEVIDLSSPSPLPRPGKPRKREHKNAKRDNVIDLSESENDKSPDEHERKARELRAFISRVRDD